jgi:hypothetical protein
VCPDDGRGESETDSDEDLEDDDTHKLRQLSHAVRLQQPITVRIRGQFEAEGDQKHEVYFQKEFWGIEPRRIRSSKSDFPGWGIA